MVVLNSTNAPNHALQRTGSALYAPSPVERFFSPSLSLSLVVLPSTLGDQCAGGIGGVVGLIVPIQKINDQVANGAYFLVGHVNEVAIFFPCLFPGFDVCERVFLGQRKDNRGSADYDAHLE